MQVVEDLVAKRVDGIAVSAANAAAMAHALEDAKEAGIPVLTWDSDLLPENADLRVAYVGTHNYDIGVNLAKIAMKIKPNGGTICIQSGGAAAANHNERMQGIRDTLGGMTGTNSPGERLTGQNGWTEVDGCPLYTNDDFPLAVQQMEDILGKYPDLDAFMPTGGFPRVRARRLQATSSSKYKDKIAERQARACRRRHAAGADRSAEGGAGAAAMSASVPSRWATRSCMACWTSRRARRPRRIRPIRVSTSARPTMSTPASAAAANIGPHLIMAGGVLDPARFACSGSQ